MADADYTFRACSVEGCLSKHKSQGLCAKHYMQSKRKGLNHYSRSIKCSHCGDEFEPGNASAMYCSKRCKHAAWVKNNPDRTALLRNRSRIKAKTSCAVSSGYCLHCGSPYCRSGRRTYCSSACVDESQKQRNRIAAREAYATSNGKEKVCRCCLSVFVPEFTGGGKTGFCSEACRDSVAISSKKKHRRISKALRRARKKDVEYEPVDPIAVFIRDKWKCQLCGRKTPKAKRGSYDDDAPEMDHIIPLSKGGSHTYKNAQCACRRCNGVKSDKPLGQMLMFG